MAAWPYNTARWKRLRDEHLLISPLCLGCQERGLIRVANTVDHNTPISAGGPAFPEHSGLTSYCASCHSQKTARGIEAGGSRTARALQPRRGCTADGTPLDPAHPWRNGR